MKPTTVEDELMPDDHKIQCPTCSEMTLPAIKCPHCETLHGIRTTFIPCSVCATWVCPQCIFVVYGTETGERPTCHQCRKKAKESSNEV